MSGGHEGRAGRNLVEELTLPPGVEPRGLGLCRQLETKPPEKGQSHSERVAWKAGSPCGQCCQPLTVEAAAHSWKPEPAGRLGVSGGVLALLSGHVPSY